MNLVQGAIEEANLLRSLIHAQSQSLERLEELADLRSHACIGGDPPQVEGTMERLRGELVGHPHRASLLQDDASFRQSSAAVEESAPVRKAQGLEPRVRALKGQIERFLKSRLGLGSLSEGSVAIGEIDEDDTPVVPPELPVGEAENPEIEAASRGNLLPIESHVRQVDERLGEERRGGASPGGPRGGESCGLREVEPVELVVRGGNRIQRGGPGRLGEILQFEDGLRLALGEAVLPQAHQNDGKADSSIDDFVPRVVLLFFEEIQRLSEGRKGDRVIPPVGGRVTFALQGGRILLVRSKREELSQFDLIEEVLGRDLVDQGQGDELLRGRHESTRLRPGQVVERDRLGQGLAEGFDSPKSQTVARSQFFENFSELPARCRTGFHLGLPRHIKWAGTNLGNTGFPDRCPLSSSLVDRFCRTPTQ